ncbi:tol-pal system YbgF family protein, partial [uncultured Hymenobacter sp.]|uniref:tetratricopeptide repeat protein n=1 Tax=uncultured Hymenobacter sp. TaxID=170016 RepID=UPI0035CAB47A
LYLVADILFQQKKYPEALDAAYKTNASNYELWQGRGFLLIADIYAAQGETFQARATLNSIIDNKFPVAEIIEGAKQRLATLPTETPAAGGTKAPAKTTPAKPGTTKATPATKGKAASRSSLVPSTEQPTDTTINRTDGPVEQEE